QVGISTCVLDFTDRDAGTSLGVDRNHCKLSGTDSDHSALGVRILGSVASIPHKGRGDVGKPSAIAVELVTTDSKGTVLAQEQVPLCCNQVAPVRATGGSADVEHRGGLVDVAQPAHVGRPGNQAHVTGSSSGPDQGPRTIQKRGRIENQVRVRGTCVSPTPLSHALYDEGSTRTDTVPGGCNVSDLGVVFSDSRPHELAPGPGPSSALLPGSAVDLVDVADIGVDQIKVIRCIPGDAVRLGSSDVLTSGTFTRSGERVNQSCRSTVMAVDGNCKDVSADLVDVQIQVGTVRELALGAQVPVKKMLCDRTHRQVRIIGGSNSICLEGMEKVPFVSSRGLLTTVSFGDNDTSQRILVSVHQVNVTEASKSSLVGDSLPLLSGRQKGGRVQLGRSPPVGVGDRSAPVVLAEFNRSLDISTGSADAGQHKSSCYWNTVRSSRVGEIH